MNSEEAFDRILATLRTAKESGIRPLIRVSGKDWVCTIEDKQTKFIIIAKEEETNACKHEIEKEYARSSEDSQSRIHPTKCNTADPRHD